LAVKKKFVKRIISFPIPLKNFHNKLITHDRIPASELNRRL